MKVKVVKEEKKIKIFIDEKEIKYIDSFKFERANNDMNYMSLNIKVLVSDIEFIDNTLKKELDN